MRLYLSIHAYTCVGGFDGRESSEYIQLFFLTVSVCVCVCVCMYMYMYACSGGGASVSHTGSCHLGETASSNTRAYAHGLCGICYMCADSRRVEHWRDDATQNGVKCVQYDLTYMHVCTHACMLCLVCVLVCRCIYVCVHVCMCLIRAYACRFSALGSTDGVIPRENGAKYT